MVQGKPRVMLVDDDSAVLKSLSRILRPSGFEILLATNGQMALELLSQHRCHVVVSDMRMPNMDGAQLLAAVAKSTPSTRRIVLTGFADMEMTVRAVNLGQIHAFVSKPWENAALVDLITEQVELQKSSQSNLQASTLSPEEIQRALQNEQKYRRALRSATHFSKLAKGQMVSDHSAMMVFIEQVCRAQLSKFEPMMNYLARYSKLAMKSAHLDEECTAVFESAVKLFLVGLLFSHNKQDRTDPYNFRQAELSLASISHLAVVGTILNLSREQYDGRGPQMMGGTHIPKVARALKVLISLAEAFCVSKSNSGKQQIVSVISKLHAKAGSLLDPELVDSITRQLSEEAGDGPIVKRVTIATLKPGWRVADDYRTERGLLLLAAGTLLTEKLIDTVQAYEGFLHYHDDILVYQ